MTIRKFQAENMAQALKLVRDALGEEALILSSKKIAAADGGGIEVVAAVDDAAVEVAEMPQRPRAQTATARPTAPRLNYASRQYQQAEFGSGRRLVVTPRSSAEEIGPISEPAPALAAETAVEPKYASVPFASRLIAAFREAGIHEDLIERILYHLHTASALPTGSDTTAFESRLRATLQKFIYVPIAEPRRRNGPSVHIFIGPTGVGKTTTLAKIAAHAKIDDRLQVGLISIDTFRIGAIEQLRTFAHIAEMPLKTAYVPAELAAAMEDFARLDMILIDTTGRNPREPEFMAELREYIETALPTETHLVLSALTRYAELQDTVNHYEAAGFNRVILTKIDEARHPAVILNLAKLTMAPLAYVGTGQNIPDDLLAAKKEMLVDLMLQKWDVSRWIN